MSAPFRPRRKSHFPGAQEPADAPPSRPRRKSKFVASQPEDTRSYSVSPQRAADGPPSRPRRKSKFAPTQPEDVIGMEEERGPSRPRRKSHFPGSNTDSEVDQSGSSGMRGMGSKKLSMHGKALLLSASAEFNGATTSTSTNASSRFSLPKQEVFLPDHLIDQTKAKEVDSLLQQTDAAKLKLEEACIQYSQLCVKGFNFVAVVRNNVKATTFDEQRAEIMNSYMSNGLMELTQALASPDELHPDIFKRKSTLKKKKQVTCGGGRSRIKHQ